MSIRIITSALLLCCCVLAQPLWAATYYVDYAAGDDGNDGRSREKPWRHSPGDASIDKASNPGATTLLPGDTVLFRGGVIYHGSIRVLASGAKDQPITYTGEGWPGDKPGEERAIIDGSEPLLGAWQPCRKEDCRDNPNWERLRWLELPDGAHALNIHFYDAAGRLWLAQDPKMPDPFWEDDKSAYYKIPAASVTRSSITDATRFNQSDPAYWSGAFALLWINPNSIVTLPIDSFDPAQHTIRFRELQANAIYADKEQRFSLSNHIDLLTRPGEYIVDQERRRIVLWPRQESDPAAIQQVVREFCFDMRRQSHVTITGFRLRRTTYACIKDSLMNNGGPPGENLVVANCELTQVKTTNGPGGSGIRLNNYRNVTIAGCHIHHNQRTSGICITKTTGLRVLNNTFDNNGYKGLWLMGDSDVRILNNTFKQHFGTHGTDASIFSSQNVLFADNTIYDSRIEIFSFEGDENLALHNNLFLGNGDKWGIVRQNGSNLKGFLSITNNLVLNSGSNNGLYMANAKDPQARYIVVNNIVDGWMASTFPPSYIVRNNLYTGLGWAQAAQYKWALGQNESVETDLMKIFLKDLDYKDPSDGGCTIRPDGIAAGKGVDLKEVLPREVFAAFPDYDFAKDAHGKPRGAVWDLGPYAVASPP